MKFKHTPTWDGKRALCLAPWPCQVLLWNRYEALQLQGQANDRGDEGLGTAQSKSVTGHIPTAGIKGESVIVVGAFLPMGAEGTACWLDPSHRGGCDCGMG